MGIQLDFTADLVVDDIKKAAKRDTDKRVDRLAKLIKKELSGGRAFEVPVKSGEIRDSFNVRADGDSIYVDNRARHYPSVQFKPTVTNSIRPNRNYNFLFRFFDRRLDKLTKRAFK